MHFFGLFRNRSVCFGCFETGPKHRNKPKKIVIGFAKQTENEPKQIEFRFVSVRTEKKICLLRGHPTQNIESNAKVRFFAPYRLVSITKQKNCSLAVKLFTRDLQILEF
jgi:hypothetical protein